MERQGFIHDMMDVKILILYTLTRTLYPVDIQQLYELCYQDDCLSYFDMREALPQLVASGHVEQREGGTYAVTAKGRETCGVVEDSLAYPVARRVEGAADRFNRQIRREGRIRTEIAPREGGDFSVRMGLDDASGSLMTLELMAPTAGQARCLANAFRSRAEDVYGMILTTLLDEIEGKRRGEE